VYARVSAGVDWMERQKCEFSSVPPSSCECTQKDFHCQEIQVDIAYDSYSSETGFELIRQDDNAVYLSSPMGSNSASKLTTISYSLLVPAGSYRLDVRDQYADGICCDYGSGSITVLNGAETIHHDGIFRDTAELTFEVHAKYTTTVGKNVAPPPKVTAAPTLSPTTTPRATLRVDIRYDDYPEEFSWELLDVTAGASVHQSKAYTVLVPREHIMTDVSDLIVGREYRLVFADVAHDGLCWAGFCGSIKVFQLDDDGSQTELWSHPGNFGASMDVDIMLK